jgi:hypothetical protein
MGQLFYSAYAQTRRVGSELRCAMRRDHEQTSREFKLSSARNPYRSVTRLGVLVRLPFSHCADGSTAKAG